MPDEIGVDAGDDAAGRARGRKHAIPGRVLVAGKSGLLFFSSGDHVKSIYLHRGEVVFATSNQRVDRIGESLLRGGAVTFEQLREAERRFTPPERFGKVLVACGFLTPRELWHGVKHQVEEVVRSLFSYTVGTVRFWEGEVQPDNVVRLSLPTRRLVAEGIQRRDELQKFLKDRGVGTEVYYPVPLHLQKCFATLGYKPGDMPNAEAAAKETVALPIFPELTEDQIRYVAAAIREFTEQ